MHSIRFTHVGLFVQDVERMAAFYEATLGFVESDRGMLDGRSVIFLTRDPDEHHELIFFSGLAGPPPEPIVNQLSFRVSDLEALMHLHRALARSGASDLDPVNHGNAWSLYFRDPEAHRIELYVPTPWYVSQPRRVPLDFDASPGTIRAETEKWCRMQPTFRTAESFAGGIREKLAQRAAAYTYGAPVTRCAGV